MPRIAAVLGTLVTAGALALGAANPALAAHGELRAGGKTYTNPSGCLNGGPIRPMTVINNTNEYAIIYDGPNCTGTSSKSYRRAARPPASAPSSARASTWPDVPRPRRW